MVRTTSEDPSGWRGTIIPNRENILWRICTRARKLLFGEIINDKMYENEIGKIVRACWEELPMHYPGIELDEFVVMPNHVHGIIVINRVGVQRVEPLPNKFQHITPGYVGTIVRSFKSAVTSWCRKHGFKNFQWQRNYFEHIIRDDKSLELIREYIATNPERWEYDKENAERTDIDKFDEWLSATGNLPIAKR